MTIVVATNNEGKLGEIRDIMSDYGIKCLSLRDAGISTDPEENADSFLGNALIKARSAASDKYPVLADDSGVCVRALGGAPGILTARYSGEHATADTNIAKLLRELDGVTDRTAHFYCCAVIIFPDGTTVSATGICRGEILKERGGMGGFGYDPIFSLPDGRCIAAIEEREKNRLSHRGRALKNLMNKLKNRGLYA